MSLRIFVLDSETRSALAVTRSLGAQGHTVVNVSHVAPSLAGASASSVQQLVSPDPSERPEEFIIWLLEAVYREPPAIIIANTEISLHVILRDAAKFPPEVLLPYPSYEAFLEVTNKHRLLEEARALGILAPKTFLLRPESFGAAETGEIAFPAVLKPVSSVVTRDGRFFKPPVIVAATIAEAKRSLERDDCRGMPYLLQEFVPGTGVGVSALCSSGTALAAFCHQRILEKPPSGGVSVLSESIAPQQAPLSEALRLLSHLRFHGVAMVEFRRTVDGRCYLLEINPRFWGSLQLAVDCGRDFPALFVALAQCRSPQEVAQLSEVCRALDPYEIGRRLRWELGTVDHALIRWRQEGAAALWDIVARNRLRCFSGHASRGEICRWSDSRPFMQELGQWWRALRGKS